MDRRLTGKTLLTLEVTRGELQAIRANALCRGMTMTGFLRSLLAAQLVDLEPQK